MNTNGINFSPVAYNYTNTGDCHPDSCIYINTGDCNCTNNCGDQLQVVDFFFVSNVTTNPCVQSLELRLNNFSGQASNITSITTGDGQVSTPTLSGSSANPVFNFNFSPNPSWSGGIVCFTINFMVGDVMCCMNICVEIIRFRKVKVSWTLATLVPGFTS